MKAAAKYLFDEDFASGEKPTITMVEYDSAARGRGIEAYRKGFTAARPRSRTPPSGPQPLLPLLEKGSPGSTTR